MAPVSSAGAWTMDGERTWFAVSAVVGALKATTPPDDAAVTDALRHFAE